MAIGETKRVFILVRTYPSPARSGIEVSCTAGVTDKGEWIRLFPVPYRYLDPDRRFQKWQWVDASVKRARDARPESYHVDIANLKIVSSVSTESEWRERWKLVRPLMSESLCALKRAQQYAGHHTLGLFKPAKIKRLKIVAEKNPDWSPREREILSQKLLGFERVPKTQLEKIPFEFRYQFECADSECRGHDISCTDWEFGQAYRSWHQKYGDQWQQKFREKFEKSMIEKNDTHFFVGTVAKHPLEWIIVGLFYPPVPKMGDLFD